jgi:mono/diheme cytochrome c family protein
MLICNQWLTRLLVLFGIWGVLLQSIAFESIAFGGTGEVGKEIYQKRCQSCHGPDGKGNAKVAQALKTQIEPITTPAILGKPEAELLKVIADGQGKMPPFGQVISEQDQRAVLSYIKQLAKETR